MNAQLSKLITAESLLAVAQKKNYTFKQGLYYLNPFGVRSKNQATNTFDDFIGALFLNENNQWEIMKNAGTTDPGTFWLKNPMKVEGTAIMVPGHHVDVYAQGKHKGEYDALVQIAPIPFYRDNDKDGNFDFDASRIYKEIIGANIHRASAEHTSVQVDKWSAACQVMASPIDYAAWMVLVMKHLDVYPNKFSYTLLEEKDFTSL